MDYSTRVDLCQPLNDKNDFGRERPWAQHRTNADMLAAVYQIVNPEKSDRVATCAPRLVYRLDEQAHMHLDTAWFCRVRLCPVCQWRRSLKIYGQTCRIIQELQQQQPEAKYIMLTLTCKNVAGDKLADCITEMVAAWHRLIKRKVWREAVLGAQRVIEITHNLDPTSQDYDTYHPHFHCILACRGNYFHRGYISHAQWAQLWRQSLKTDYRPIVEVHRIRGQILEAAKEITKYTTKPGDYIIPDDVDMMIESVRTLDNALHHRRLIAWVGSMKQAHEKLQLDDIDAGDLIHTDGQRQADMDEQARVAFAWLKSHRQYYKEI